MMVSILKLAERPWPWQLRQPHETDPEPPLLYFTLLHDRCYDEASALHACTLIICALPWHVPNLERTRFGHFPLDAL